MKKYNYKILEIDEDKYVECEYPVIIFNNEYLPPGAIFIDFCASNNFFSEVDESLSLWFWKFTICVGRFRSEKSETVIRYSQELKKLIIDNESDVKKNIGEKYGVEKIKKIYEWWTDTLDIVITSAGKSTQSKWIALPNRK